MVQTMLTSAMPHRDTGSTAHERTDGLWKLTIENGLKGLPFGSYARLMIAWITKQAAQNRNPRVELPNGTRSFFREILGKENPSGAQVSVAKEQLVRLLTSRLVFEYSGSSEVQKWRVFNVAEGGEMTWVAEEETGKTQSASNHVVLDKTFYEEVVTNSIPFR